MKPLKVLKDAVIRQPRLPRYLCHLYQRVTQGRLNLVTGAGISVDAKVPNWFGLLDRLAGSSSELAADLGAHRSMGLNPEYLGQIIFHRFKRTCDVAVPEHLRVATVNYDWADAIHQSIYRDVDGDIQNVVRAHPYLDQLRTLARRVPLVFNFNFDDILADAIGDQVKAGVSGNSFSVTWNPPLGDRASNTTIYHVNGILPRVSLKKRSPHLIFTEDSFADALSRSPGVSSEYIVLRFVQSTMLIVGHSLADSSLKNYLRINRDKMPANYHYMIYWLREDGALSASQIEDVFEANLELYNVITIFLTSAEIEAFLLLLNMTHREFGDAVDQLGEDRRSHYHYYIVGPVAAGKSTLIEQLRCFNTFEEWTRPPPPEMYLSSDKIDGKQQGVIDEFIFSELKEKNRRMHAAPIGFHFMDRAPLDLYAFSQDDAENVAKSKELRRVVLRDKPLQRGEILFLEASPETLVSRNMARGRPPDAAGKEDYFGDQIAKLKDIYQPSLTFSTDRENAGQIARSIARHVLFNDYKPIDLDTIIPRFE